MILKVFDVAAGSCNFIMTSTGKTELVDFGANFDWSPVQHIYSNYIESYGTLNRLVLTHHHGDHLKDLDSFGSRQPSMVVRRKLEGEYLAACVRSNSDSGMQIAAAFSSVFDSWNETPSYMETSAEAWGVKVLSQYLTVGQAQSISSTDNSLVNNCSYVRLYDHAGTKILLCGDMEKEGMALLLQNNPSFRSALAGVDVLVAPHHGHRTGFCTELFDAMGRPAVVIASMMSGDNYVDTRYSDSQYVRSIPFDDGSHKLLLTTRTHGAMTVASHGGGSFYVTVNQR